MSARMRVTRAHTGNRRSHHALKEPRLSTCVKCSAKHLRHRMCPECGSYRGREVVNVVAKKESRMKRREENMKAMGAEIEKHEEEVHNAPKDENLKKEGKKGSATVKTSPKAEAKKEK